MNEGTQPKAVVEAPALPNRTPKKIYSPPTLVRFGQVAALTQSGTAFCHDDSTTCSSSASMTGRVSDRRTKENVHAVGRHPLGINLYLFDYKQEYRDEHGYGRQFGVMADEVAAVMPEAVSPHADGYMTVRYDLLGIRQAR
jgi:hypothetical protein